MATNRSFRTAYPESETLSFLSRGMLLLHRYIQARLQHHFGKAEQFEQPSFEFVADDSPLAQYVSKAQCSIEEFVILLLALVPHIQPSFLDSLIRAYLPKGGELPEFGGLRGKNYRGVLPTGETALFVLAGNDFEHRLRVMQWLQNDGISIFQKAIVQINSAPSGEPNMSGSLSVNPEYISLFLTGKNWQPQFNRSFPAARLHTQMNWEDLVLSNSTLQELNIIQAWLEHQETLRKDMQLGKRLKPGFKALFFGKPGTGKTLTATLLGKLCQKEVYRVDLSMVVSKYIGETEKNLQNVFDTAAHKNWILFFDEADALFGKRTEIKSSKDRFANQEVSYLLQKVEEHDGLVILASNFKRNLDPAFMRRFQVVVPFLMPNAEQRLKLWQKTLPDSIPLSNDLEIHELARKYDLTGASILNIVHKASIKALNAQTSISHRELMDGIREEYAKVGKSL